MVDAAGAAARPSPDRVVGAEAGRGPGRTTHRRVEIAERDRGLYYTDTTVETSSEREAAVAGGSSERPLMDVAVAVLHQAPRANGAESRVCRT